jgi:hypothetical protein
MHHVELDQSGRTEKQNEPSALAFGNGIHASIRLSGKTKRAMYAVLKARYTRLPNLHLRVFVAAVFFLIKRHLKQLASITIDREFDGHDNELKSLLLRHIWTVVPDFPQESITIASIGKKSPAHDLAHRVFLKKQPPDQEVQPDDLLPLI